MGLKYALLNERNFRILILCSLLVILGTLLLNFSFLQQIMALILMAGLLSFELMNSAVENCCNASGSKFDLHKKNAKDMAASSVLIFCLLTLFCLCSFLLSQQNYLPELLKNSPLGPISLLGMLAINFPLCLRAPSIILSIASVILSISFHCIIAFQIASSLGMLCVSFLIHSALCYSHLKRSTQKIKQ